MFRKPIYRYLLAGLLIVVLIGAGSAIAYRAGLAQGAGFEGMVFERMPFSERDAEGFRGFGHMPYGRTGHFGGFGFSPFFSMFGMLFHFFLILIVFKFIFRLLFFPFGMRRRRMMHGKHGHPGMWGWHEGWDDEEDKTESTENKSENTAE